MNQVITRQQLKAYGACYPALVQFEYAFGDSVELTEENVMKYYYRFSLYDIEWAADHLLPLEDVEKYQRIREEPHRKDLFSEEDWREYKKKMALTFFKLYTKIQSDVK